MMIRSVARALSWEYWRRGMLWFVPTIFALMIGCNLLMTMQRFEFRGFPWAVFGEHLREALIPFVLTMPLILAFASWTALRRHYVLPVPTGSLVVWSLANGTLATAAVYCCTAMTFRVPLHADWPYTVPALWAATVYVAYQAALWWLGPSRGLLGVLAATGCASLAVMGKLYDGQLPLFQRVEMPLEWKEVSGLEVVVWFGAIALSFVMAVNGVARDRRGEAWSLAWLSRYWSATTDAISRLGRSAPGRPRFRSPASAQFWYAWKTRGRMLPLTVTGMLCAMGLFFKFLEPHEVTTVLGSFTAMFVIASPLIGVYLGSQSNGFDLKSFVATRPLPDHGLAAAVLRSAAAGVGSSAIVWLAGSYAAHAIWARSELEVLWQVRRDGLAFNREFACVLIVVVLASWTLVGLGASLALARQRFVCWGGPGIVALLMSFFCVLDRVSPDVGEVLAVLAANACLGGTIAAFVVARCFRVLSGRAVFLCVASYLILLVYLYLGIPPPAGESALTHSLRIGFGAAPFAPVALAPLALSWNRHR